MLLVAVKFIALFTILVLRSICLKTFLAIIFLRSCSGMGWDDLFGEGCEVIVLSNKSAQ